MAAIGKTAGIRKWGGGCLQWVVSGQPIDDQPLLQPCGIIHEVDGLSCLA